MGGGTPSQDLRFGGRGVPHPRSGLGGYPPQDLGWGAPQTWDGVPPRHGMGYPQTWDGYPPDLGWCTPWTWDGVPSPRPGMRYPPRPGMGYSPRHGTGYPPDMEWGTPQTWDRVPPPPRQISIASTCYVAGGRPLAFTQEDFLVKNILTIGGESQTEIFC